MAKKREIGFIERERELSTRHLVKTLRRERIFRPGFPTGFSERIFRAALQSGCWNVKAHVLSITASFNQANVGSYGSATSREVKLADVTSLRKV